MSRIKLAIIVSVLISIATLVWVAMPTIRAAVPTWIIIDAIVAQAVLMTAVSGALKR